MNRYSYLIAKERKGALTNEENDELFDMREEEFNEKLLAYEQVGFYKTQWGWM